MPPVIAAAAAFAASAAFEAALGAVIINAGLGIGLSVGQGIIATQVAGAIAGGLVSMGVSAALTKAPKAPEAVNVPIQQRDRTLSVRQAIAARRIVYGNVRLGGAITYLEATEGNQYLHVVLTLAGHEVSEIGNIWLQDDYVELDEDGNATGKFAGLVRVRKNLGTADQEAFADLVAESNGKWTTDHRQRGCACIYVRLKYDRDKFPAGLPNITTEVWGKKVYDPRTDETVYSANAALCVADWLCEGRYSIGETYGDAIFEERLIASANVCDEDIERADEETEKRYELHGAFESSQNPGDMIERLLTGMAGKAIKVGAAWHIHAGAYEAPEITLDENDLRGGFRVQVLQSRRENFNAVKGLFINPDKDWQPDDFPPIASDAFMEEDGGERVWRDIDLAFTKSASMAQRLAKIELMRMRQPILLRDVPFKVKAYRLQPGDTVGFTYERFGWAAKPFEVQRSVLVTDPDDQGGAVLGVNLTLREVAADSYDWSADEERTVDPAPNSNLPNVGAVAKPSSLTLESGDPALLGLNEGSVISRIWARWTPPENAFAVQYEIQWKRSTDSTWESRILGGDSVEYYITPVADGIAYDVRVRSINFYGQASDWETLAGHVVVGKSEPPPRADTFSVTRLPDGTRRFYWSLANPPADVRSGGGYRVRYYAGTTDDWDAMTPLHEGKLLSAPYETNELAAGTYTFAIRTEDSSGNLSTVAKFITGVVLGDPRLQGAVYDVREEDTGWGGTLADCFVDTDNVIRAASDGDWDDLPATWDDLDAAWDDILPNKSPISYTTLVIDLGADLAFTPFVTVVANGSAVVEMKTGTATDGNVTGSWAAPAVVTQARYVQFRVTITDATASLSSMAIILDGQSTTETFDDVDTDAETALWFDSVAAGHFKIGSRVGDLASISQARIVALQNVGPGFSWELISKSETVNGHVAAEFKVYDGSGTLANAVVDVELRGPKAV